MTENKTEQNILSTEKEILKEIKKEEVEIQSIKKKQLLLSTILGLTIVCLVVGGAYYLMASKRIYVEKAQISAPEITLSPQTAGGQLQEVFADVGDVLPANTGIARVGNEIIKTKIDGLIISLEKNIGTTFNRGQAVAKMIDPKELRVVGRVEEDKGLTNISVGQNAIFTVDAYGSKEFSGIVDEISPTARTGDIVFSISSKRAVSEFNVKVRFDTDKYPELTNGMSAKIWIYR
jgi:multidrug resistance efflux pump